MRRLDALKVKFRQLQDKVKAAQDDADEAQTLADKAEEVRRAWGTLTVL